MRAHDGSTPRATEAWHARRADAAGARTARATSAIERRAAHHCRQSTGPATSVWLPSGRPSTSLGLARGAEQRLEVDARLDPHLVQHRDEVLGGDVAGRARRHRAAAELAEARLERVDAGLERGEHVRQPLAAGVVEVRGQLDAAAERLARGREELAHLRRVRHAGGVAEADLLRAGGRAAARRCRSTRSGSTWPS